MENLARRREMTMRRKAATALDRLMVILSAGFLAWLAFIAVNGDVEWNGDGDYPTAVEAIDPNAKARLNGVANLPD
jgi:hypothetical protein